MDVVSSDDNVIYATLEDDEGIQVIGLNIDLESNAPGPETVIEELVACNAVKLQVVDKEPPPSKKPNSSFTCLICGKKFNQNAGRYNHMKKVHNIFPGEKTNVRCLEKDCSFTCSYKEKLQLHLIEEHGIGMDVRMETFDDWASFQNWKEDFERQEKSRFVKKSGPRLRDEGMRVTYYYCNRSGTYTSHSKGLKSCKKKGTSKSSHHCTASLTCVETSDGKVEVKICATHYGHDTDLQHLRLTQKEKCQIAEQLLDGVPPDVVLDNIRSSICSDIDRIHLITIKDVKNIERAFGIQTCANEKSVNRFCNLDYWVANISKYEHSPVLYFNEKGQQDQVDYNLILMLMTVGQLEVLQKYGRSGIYYINSLSICHRHYVNQQCIRSKVFITTLIVVDDLNEAVPVSFLISSQNDRSTLTLFLETLKKKMPEISAKAVLTDDNVAVYEAWCSVFVEGDEKVPYHLWSNRFVDKDWRDNLISIPDEGIQVSIYEKLYQYLEKTDPTNVETSLKSYVVEELLTCPSTSEFGNYFLQKYIGSERLWAGCYGKKIVGVKAQLNMENLSNEIEGIGERKILDKNYLVRIVQNLLKLVSDNHCHRKEKLERKVQEIPIHHKLSLNIKLEAISQTAEGQWRVNSVRDPENIFQIVKKRIEKCSADPCIVSCSKCRSCAHEFQCSCGVYDYDKTMCKHIHAIAMNFFPKPFDSNSADENSQSCGKELSLLKLESLLKRKKRKKSLSEENKNSLSEEVSEENLLPVIEKVLRNSKIRTEKRKRGRPRKIRKVSTAKTKSKTNKEAAEQINPSVLFKESPLRFRRKINILRKGSCKLV